MTRNIKVVGEAAANAFITQINKKLTQVSSMPESPALNTIVLYIGTTTSSYIQGNIYQWDGTKWNQINQSGEEQGIPDGGTTGQVLTKRSNADGDVDWEDVSGGVSENEIAPVEATSTASKAYAVGDLLIYDGKLYKVTTAIANGGTIITTGGSTNVVATTVAENLGTTLTSTVTGSTLTFSNSIIGENSILEGPYLLNKFGLFKNATYTAATHTVTYTFADNSFNGLNAILIVKG